MDLGELTAKIKKILKKVTELYSNLLVKVFSAIETLVQKKRSAKNIETRQDETSDDGQFIDDELLIDDEQYDASVKPPTESAETKNTSLPAPILILGNLWKALPGFLIYLENKYLHRFPNEKRRIILFGIGGTAMLFLLLVVSIPVTLSGRPRQAAPASSVGGFTIPSEELFSPSEPDFLPEFILEREPRSFWNLDDLRPYWRAPESTEPWREQITSTVDRIMETVP